MAAYLAFPTGNSTFNPEFDQPVAHSRLIRSTYFYPNYGPFIRLEWMLPDIHFVPPGFDHWQRRRPNVKLPTSQGKT